MFIINVRVCNFIFINYIIIINSENENHVGLPHKNISEYRLMNTVRV